MAAPLSESLLGLLQLCKSEEGSLDGVLVSVSWSDPEVIECCGQCLDWFVQLNWTGPPAVGILTALEGVVGQERLKLLNQEALALLSVDGEAAYRLCSVPFLLEVCCGVLGWWVKREEASWRVKRLALRSQFLRQQLLSHPCSSLWSLIRELVEELGSESNLHFTEEEQCMLYLELSHVCLYYLQYDTAKMYLDKAGEILHISTELTGILGKRTRFQQTDVAQLVLQVSAPSHPEQTSPSPTPPEQTSPMPTVQATQVQETTPPGTLRLPKEVSMNDETVLDKVELSSAQAPLCLNSLQQAVLLGSCIYHKKTKAQDSLAAEELEAYLSCVLGIPQCWSVQAHALFLRASQRGQRYRYQQRNMMQLEELVSSFRSPEPEAGCRFTLFYCVPLVPVWMVEKELATVLVQLGALNSATEVLTRLEMWEELAVCYQGVGRKAKAKEIVQEQLQKQPTASLLCLMGDIVQDPEWYRQAWEVSSFSSARAQRSLGLWHLRREEYAESIECLQKSLAINSLQDGLWFSLGCAASQIGDTQLSIKAWHRAVTLQPDFAEAWNNLAGAHLKNKDKKKAHRIFHEALRWSYHDPKIWENYLLVSAELSLWSDCLRAYHMLCQLDSKFLDVEILCLLVKGCSPDNTPSPSVHESLGKLLGRIAARGKVDAVVWKLYADFHFSSDDRADHIRGVEELQKAQRAARLQAGWERELKSVVSVSTLTLDYSRASRKLYGEDREGLTEKASGGVAERKQAVATLSSAKLALQGVISKAKSFGLTNVPEMESILTELDTELNLVMACIDQQQSALTPLS